MRMLIIFILMPFLPFSTVQTNTICMRFHFDPLSENSQRISVDGRPERIEMYAFSNENALEWTRHFLNQSGVNLINLLQM